MGFREQLNKHIVLLVRNYRQKLSARFEPVIGVIPNVMRAGMRWQIKSLSRRNHESNGPKLIAEQEAEGCKHRVLLQWCSQNMGNTFGSEHG